MSIINSIISGGGTAPECYRVFRTDNGVLKNSITTPFIQLPSSVTTLELFGAFYQCYKDTPANVLSGAIDLSSVVTISGGSACTEMFYNCPGITSVDLSSLKTISNGDACNSMFGNCTGITSINLSSLETVSSVRGTQYMFQGCTGLTSVVLTSLKTISSATACQNMFNGCTGLTSLSFPALKSNSFSNGINGFFNIISGVTGCTLHFPSNLDPAGGSTTISSLGTYPNFGGTNTVLAFDLPATE
ncbi:MAG: leucine-rich repeat protein [Clostridia bacterium]|nr:leucine-rich repeat protein [Clostridia bacterium]